MLNLAEIRRQHPCNAFKLWLARLGTQAHLLIVEPCHRSLLSEKVTETQTGNALTLAARLIFGSDRWIVIGSDVAAHA